MTTGEHVQSFDAVSSPDAHVLILGSMPGAASLAAKRYYAHPRNAFWPIMAELLPLDLSCPYEERLEALRGAGIALWDVLHSCHRDGSLDARIRPDTQVANDFAVFLRAHPLVERVLFNGAKAEQCYRQHVLRYGIGAGLRYERLPSTSPANASWSFARKLAAWRNGLRAELPNQLRVTLR
ncbi:MAG: DNA-deoxyinosine glycosylase [Candidatus Binatia bacterium]